MTNQIADFMHEYHEKDMAHKSEVVSQEIYVCVVDKEGVVISHPLAEECTTGKTHRRYLGGGIECCDVESGKRCGEGDMCSDCVIRKNILQSIQTRTPLVKKVIKKQVVYNGLKTQRYFRISTIFLAEDKEQILVILDDITRDHQLLEFQKIEHYLRDHIQLLTYDDIVKYCVDHARDVISSEFIIMYMLDDKKGFTKRHFMSDNVDAFVKNRNYDDFIERKLWLQCIIEKDVVIDNYYQASQKNNGYDATMPDINSVLLAPILDFDTVKGVIIIGNKPEPYNIEDIKLVENFTHALMELIHYKKESESLKKEQLLQKNLAETVDVGLVRYLSSDKSKLVLDYMNEAVVKIFNFKDRKKIGSPDVFIPYMDETCVKSFLTARDIALENESVFKWTGLFDITGQKKWLQYHLIPGHIEDRGLCWEGSITDVTDITIRCDAVNQIRNKIEDMVLKNDYTKASIIALLDDLKKTINQ